MATIILGDNQSPLAVEYVSVSCCLKLKICWLFVGDGYSVNEISQPYLDPTTRQVDISFDYTLFGEPVSMFEIKYPNTDIRIRVKG